MDSQGYRVIRETLENAGIAASIIPEPIENETFEYVTIRTQERLAPAAVLNTLGQAGLMAETAQQTILRQERSYADSPMRRTSRPKLELILGETGSLTFVDLHYAQ